MIEPICSANPDQPYEEAAATYAAALERLARAYEANPDRRQDLLQDIHLALWRSFEHFVHRCSLRTWVYRVAHNVATSHVVRQHRTYAGLASLEEIENAPVRPENEIDLDRSAARERLLLLIQRLKPVDRQVILSYLEGLDAASIGEITGISPAHVAMKIHRIKGILIRRFQKGGQHAR
ncbi:MAG: sigma-70 family RNA polymerase sigma factor [Bryobacteraceae bacterium]